MKFHENRNKCSDMITMSHLHLSNIYREMNTTIVSEARAA